MPGASLVHCGTLEIYNTGFLFRVCTFCSNIVLGYFPSVSTLVGVLASLCALQWGNYGQYKGGSAKKGAWSISLVYTHNLKFVVQSTDTFCSNIVLWYFACAAEFLHRVHSEYIGCCSLGAVELVVAFVADPASIIIIHFLITIIILSLQCISSNNVVRIESGK